jgi:NADH-quinone oxidoreductase subunit J
MFLNLKDDNDDRKAALLKMGAGIASGSFLLVMVGALKQVKIDATSAASFDSQVGMVENLGKVLFTQFLLPFELASILLLVAMVGAVLLARREEGERNTF